MYFFIFIILPILFILILFSSTRNLETIAFYGVPSSPVKFKLYVYIGTLVMMFIPTINIITFVTMFSYIIDKISKGDRRAYCGWRLKEDKKNWIYSLYKLLTKEL